MLASVLPQRAPIHSQGQGAKAPAFPFLARLLGTPHSPPPRHQVPTKSSARTEARPPRSPPRRPSSTTDQRRCIVAIPPSLPSAKGIREFSSLLCAVYIFSSASIHAHRSPAIRRRRRRRTRSESVAAVRFPCSIHQLPSPFPAANLCCLLGAVDCFHRYDFFDVDELAKRPLIFYRPIIRLRAPMFFPHRYLSWA
ncbi:hypothetical protein PVAP13_2KG586750 [Panicum virgatum]|uniref:Uncharacterized protein n=1 Tax=Panicum virgatum TaxID=38727 RepID=A0A8T0WN98_PANVG|nr:hypothetical protein PVAP13_2KG586750 [Panicum virgatum]